MYIAQTINSPQKHKYHLDNNIISLKNYIALYGSIYEYQKIKKKLIF